MGFGATLAAGVAAFAATNLDDILLLAALFADRRIRGAAVVAGQFLGIGALTAASALAALAALAVPPGWAGLLGLLPLAIGLRLLAAPREQAGGEAGADTRAAAAARRGMGGQVLAVAGVTVANGGDNLAVYVPLFAADPAALPLLAAVFAAMTALWCAAGAALVRHKRAGARMRRWGPRLLPWVLVALGLHILWGARVLLG